MKKYIAAILVLTVLITAPICVKASGSNATSEDYIPSETILTPLERVRTESEDIEILQECLTNASERMKAAHNMAEGARGLDYEETHAVIKLAVQEYKLAHEDYLYYASKIELIKKAEEEAFFQQKAEEYPAATEIWLYFKNQGFSDYVCAGLLGNFMAEVGGQTLNIQYWLNGNGYYGMAQWCKKYFPGVVGCDLQGQCDYLMSNIEKTFETYGKNYQQGFTYEKFLALEDEKAVALAFAKVYERCGSGSYNVRQTNATKALQYFTSAPTADAQ